MTSSFDTAASQASVNQALWSPPTDVRENLYPTPQMQSLRGSRSNDSKDNEPSGTIRSSVFNLTNTILGSGTLAMPYACKLCGVGVFVALLFFTALLADYAVRALFLAVERLRVQRPRYPSMGRAALGKPGELLSSWSVTLQQIGACIAYIVIIGDVLQPIVQLTGWGEWVCMRWPLQLFLIVFVIFPLCLLPSMDNLKYVSVVSLLLIWATVFAVVINGALVLSDPRRRNELIEAEMNATNQSGASKICGRSRQYDLQLQDTFPLLHNTSAGGGNSTGGGSSEDTIRMLPLGVGQILSAMPILAFAFLCHQNSFPIYKELINPSPRRMSQVGHWSISICCFVYMLSGVTGYYTFLEHTESNLLKNFPVKGTYFSLPMDAVRTGFGLSMVLSFPLMVWEARHNLDVLIFGDRPYTFWRNFGINLAIIAFTGAIGMSVGQLDQVLTVVGSTCSPLMVYVLPASFYLVAANGENHRSCLCTFCNRNRRMDASGAGNVAPLDAPLINETEANAAAGVLLSVDGSDSSLTEGKTGASTHKSRCCFGCMSDETASTLMLWYGMLLIPCCLFVWVLEYLICGGGSGTVSKICTQFGF